MYCTKCGKPMAETARFCTNCGHPATDASTGSWTGSAASAAPNPKLRRIVAQKKIAGVCAGFAEYFRTDLTLMRVIWIALLLLPPHIGLIAYIVSWAVLPKG